MSHEQLRAHVLSKTPHIAVVSNGVSGVVGRRIPGITLGKEGPEGRIGIQSDPDVLKDLG